MSYVLGVRNMPEIKSKPNADINRLKKQINIDDGGQSVKEGSFHQLTEGAIVQIKIGQTQTADYWEAEKVIVYIGEKKKQVAKSLESEPPVINTKASPNQSREKIQKKNSSPVVLENGVWHNLN